MYQRILTLSKEATNLHDEVKVALGEWKAATTDKDVYKVAYDNLVAREKDLNCRLAALEAQLAGTAKECGGQEVAHTFPPGPVPDYSL